MTNTSYTEHRPVLMDSLIFELTKSIPNLDASILIADCTFGGGGHSIALAKNFPNARIMAIDQDGEAIANGQKRILEEKLEKRIFLQRSNFINFNKCAEEFFRSFNLEEISRQNKFDIILADLGVSTHQILSGNRGFSYQNDGPLDMRMDQSKDNELTAADVINTFSEKDLQQILTQYGEVDFVDRIVREIIVKRKECRIETTKELENIIFHCYPKILRFKGSHPATKTFQALRIFVNRELEVLEESLSSFIQGLEVNGLLCVMTFHSLEDRLVKHFFKESAQKKLGSLYTKKPIVPSEQELLDNRRARSSKLRIFRRDRLA